MEGSASGMPIAPYMKFSGPDAGFPRTWSSSGIGNSIAKVSLQIPLVYLVFPQTR